MRFVSQSEGRVSVSVSVSFSVEWKTIVLPIPVLLKSGCYKSANNTSEAELEKTPSKKNRVKLHALLDETISLKYAESDDRKSSVV